MSALIWGASSLRLQFSFGTDASVSLVSIGAEAGFRPETDPSIMTPPVDQPLVEISAMGHGRLPGSFRHVDTVLSRSLRYVDHEQRREEGVAELRIIQADKATGLQVTSVFVARDGISGFRTWTEVTVVGVGSYTLDFVSTLATGAYLVDSATAETTTGSPRVVGTPARCARWAWPGSTAKPSTTLHAAAAW